MKTETSLRDLILYPETESELRELRESGWKQPFQFGSQKTKIAGSEYELRDHLTFTPYANPRPCSARCRFCSEELLRKNQKHLSSKQFIREFTSYFSALKRVLADLQGVENLGLSLSGLEATADPEWLAAVLNLLDGENSPAFNEKVLYSNGSGLIENPYLIRELERSRFDRIEISRVHFDEKINGRVMRFSEAVKAAENRHFESLLTEVNSKIPLRLSCLMTKETISSLPQIEHYLSWAKKCGITQVVFREMSQLNGNYEENGTKKWITGNRVSLKDLLDETNHSPAWEYQFSHCGYYYYNEHFLYDGIEVTLETSSYPLLISHNHEAMIHKLVFHSNGNLCGDWDPDNRVIGNYYEL